MKKTIIIFGLLFCSYQIVAQKLGFAAETGLTTSRFSDNQFRRRYTYHVGVNSTISLQPNLHVNAGLSYVRKGAIFDPFGIGAPSNPIGPTNDVNFDYLEFAALLGYGSENFQLRVGPTYSLLTQARIRFPDADLNITDIINDRELGIKVSLFAKFRSDKSPYLTASYYQGFDDTNFDPSARVTNNYFQLSLGYVLVSNQPFDIN